MIAALEPVQIAPKKQVPRVAEPVNLNFLLERIASRDADSLKTLHNLIGPRLFAVLVRMVKRREVAEDLLQDVFVTIWTKAHQFDARRGNAEVWLFSITRRKAIDRLRIATREMVGAEMDVATQERPSAVYPVGDHESYMSVKRCLTSLKPDIHQALRLCYAFGMTHEELAIEMKVPLGTAKTWVRQGLRQLKEYLTAHEPDGRHL